MNSSQESTTSKATNFVSSSHPQAKISRPHTKKSLPWWPIIIALLILIGIGISYAFYSQQIAIPEKTPQERVQEMFIKMGEVYSFSYQLSVSLQIPPDILQQTTEMGLSLSNHLFLTSQGMMDESDQNNPKTQQSWRLGVGGEQEDTLILDVNTKLIDQESYFIINQIMPILFLDLNALKNKWVSFNEEELKQLGVEIMHTRDYEIFRSHEKQIQQLIENKELLHVVQELPVMTKEGTAFYPFRAQFQEENFVALLKEIQMIDKTILPDESIQTMQDFLTNAEFENMIIVVGENSYLSEMSTTITFMDESIPDIQISFTLDQFNENFTITPPTNYLTTTEFIELINQQLLLLSPETSMEEIE